MGLKVKHLRVDHVVHIAIVSINALSDIFAGQTVCGQYEWWDKATFDITKGASFVEAKATCLTCLAESG